MVRVIGVALGIASCTCAPCESAQPHRLQPTLVKLMSGHSSIERAKVISVCELENVKSQVHPPGYIVEPKSGMQFTGVSEIWFLENGFKLVGVHYFPKPRPEQYQAIDAWFAKVPMPPPPNFAHIYLLDYKGLQLKSERLR